MTLQTASGSADGPLCHALALSGTDVLWEKCLMANYVSAQQAINAASGRGIKPSPLMAAKKQTARQDPGVDFTDHRRSREF
jgi:hypothetical protein